MKPGKCNILIVDDNHGILKSLRLLLKSEFEEIETVSDPEKISSLLGEKKFDIVLLDMNFKSGVHSGNEGLFWLRKIKEYDQGALVILITAYGDIQLAVKVIKEGAYDFIQKPWDPDKLIITLRSACNLKKSQEEVKRLRNRNLALNNNLNRVSHEIAGNSKVMKEVIKVIDKVAGTNANILILGENGTGKELVAREIHRKSKRKNEAFVSVDMGSISHTLFESELFGHLKGSFTDAKEDKPGRFESADGGTLFLDEIGNLPLSMQSKILSVLQNREIFRIGSARPTEIDIRLISATNSSIDEMMQQNLFREDLYFRMNTIEIKLPPLRERDNDIIILAESFLEKYKSRYSKPALRFSKKDKDKFLKHTWPGNIRELKHFVERLVILSDGKSLGDIDFQFGKQMKSTVDFPSYKLEDVEKQLIEKVIGVHKGNMSKVARELNISRTTLYAKINKYEI